MVKSPRILGTVLLRKEVSTNLAKMQKLAEPKMAHHCFTHSKGCDFCIDQVAFLLNPSSFMVSPPLVVFGERVNWSGRIL